MDTGGDRAVSDDAAGSIIRGPEQALEYARGRGGAARVHVPQRIDVRAIREKLGMTQQEIAATFGFSVHTLRHWEQGLRNPEGPTRAYLRVIERGPEAVRRTLHAA
jgi:putative transcriptional regulator